MVRVFRQHAERPIVVVRVVGMLGWWKPAAGARPGAEEDHRQPAALLHVETLPLRLGEVNVDPILALVG